MPNLYRKRLIPNECVSLDKDIILYNENDFLITKWDTIKPKKEFAYGFSLYDIQKGFKISKFYNENGTFLYWYCDIIETDYDAERDTYIFTDLLADVIIYPNGNLKVVDLDELVTASKDELITINELYDSITKTSTLLNLIYSGEFKSYTDMLDEYTN